MRITRTTNPNGTYRYEIAGEVIYAASKVLYTHASTYAVGEASTTMFHKTDAAAQRAKGYPRSGWVKTGTQTIEDGDTAAPAPAVDEPSTVELWETHEGETHGYDAEGDRVIEISARVRPNAWNGHTDSNLRSWAVIRDGVAASGQADGLRAAKKAATAALAQIATRPAPEPRQAPRKGTTVRPNSTYRGVAFKGRQGKVESIHRGEDGNQYVTVDFGSATWIYLVTELDEVTTPRRCGWCGEPLTANQGKFCSRSCTVRQQNRTRARQR